VEESMIEQRIIVFVVSFKRKRTATKSEGWETDLFVGRDEADEKGFIVDMQGRKVETIYDYYNRFAEGCLIVREP
jgi:hypothetical protein